MHLYHIYFIAGQLSGFLLYISAEVFLFSHCRNETTKNCVSDMQFLTNCIGTCMYIHMCVCMCACVRACMRVCKNKHCWSVFDRGLSTAWH